MEKSVAGSYKVRWDAAIDINSVKGRMGVGAIVRDLEGNVIGTLIAPKGIYLQILLHQRHMPCW